MALAAKISPAELTAQVTDRFAGSFFEARLVNAPGVTYLPGTTDDTSFLAFEVPVGTGGYTRQSISYAASDVTNYTDDGVGLTTRATIFAHDGVGSAIGFSHVVLVWSTGNALDLTTVNAFPSAAVDGVYENIPVDSSSGDGEGLSVDLTVSGSGGSSADYALTLASSGRGYVDNEVLTIEDGTLAGLGIISPGSGLLSFNVAGVSSQASAGQILAVAQTSGAVQLTGGNEAAFYWNLKQFGFYSTAG